MPKRKRSFGRRGAAKRRRYASKLVRRAVTRRRNRIPRGMLSQRKVLKMRWTKHFNIDVGAGGALAYQNLSCNSLAAIQVGDPHQPMYYNECSALYNDYTVLGAKLTAWITTRVNTANAPNIAGIFISDDLQHATTKVTHMVEQNRTMWKLIPNTMYTRPTVITKKFSPKKHFNVKDMKDNKATLSGKWGTWNGSTLSGATSPSNEAYFVLYAGCTDEATDTAAMHCFVKIDYIVMCSEPKEQTQS